MGAICVVYVAARLWRLDASCLWFDEIFSVHAAEHEWWGLFSFIAKDLIHPPLFYVVLKAWITVGGESVFWLRLLPVVFSALALVPFIYLGRELKFTEPVLIIATFLFAVNGALIKYTQTLRMYSMLVFLALLSTWLFARYFNRGKSFIPLVIANLLLVYTHYFGWLIVGAEVVAILWFQRIKWARVAIMSGILTIAYVPWLLSVVQAARSGSSLAQNIAWQSRPGIRELITFATDLVEPFYYQASSVEPASIYFVSVPLVLILLASLTLYFIGWKDEENKQRVYLLLLFAAMPFVVAFIASWLLPHSVWGTRHLIVIFPPLMLLIAHAIWNLTIPIARVAALSFLGALAILGLAINVSRATPRHVWCEWNNVASNIVQLESGNQRPVKIYAFENLVAYHLWFALRQEPRFHVDVAKGLDVRTDDGTYFLPRGFDSVAIVPVEEIVDDQLWLAFRNSQADEQSLITAAFARRGYAFCAGDRTDYSRTGSVMWIQMSRTGCTK